jgi:hypothetical protein
MTTRSTRRLGELLLERGLISQRELEQALARQQMTGAFLGELLVEMGFVPLDAVLDALAEQFGLRREGDALARVVGGPAVSHFRPGPAGVLPALGR